MSWIKLSDGRYVKDPIFYGKEWFLSCQYEPTLTVHIYREPSEQGLLKRMRKILREANIPAKIVKDETAHRDVSAFPPNFKGLKQAASVRVEFLNLPLPSELSVHTGLYAELKPKEVLNESSESVGAVGQKHQGGQG